MEENKEPTATSSTPFSVSSASSNIPSVGELSQNNTYLFIIAVLILLAVLGINVVFFTENILTYIWRFITDILGIFGYSVGSGIDIVADATTDTAKLGIDIVGDAVGDVGKLLKQGSAERNDVARRNIDDSINSVKRVFTINDPDPTPGDDPIQKPISTNKNNWCLVGEDNGARNCVSVDQHDECMSGQLFPEQSLCLNPTYTPNV